MSSRQTVKFIIEEHNNDSKAVVKRIFCAPVVISHQPVWREQADAKGMASQNVRQIFR
jgi:hypothetical protein